MDDIDRAFEPLLQRFASALATEFNLSKSDVLQVIRSQFGKTRAAVAADLRTEAAQLPAVVAAVEAPK